MENLKLTAKDIQNIGPQQAKTIIISAAVIRCLVAVLVALIIYQILKVIH